LYPKNRKKVGRLSRSESREKTSAPAGSRIYRILVGNMEEENHLEELDVDGRLILKCNFKNCSGTK
jgi:hypothetical protein